MNIFILIAISAGLCVLALVIAAWNSRPRKRGFEVLAPDDLMDRPAPWDCCPEGCCPSCWTEGSREVQMRYNERWDQDVCPECGYT